MQKFSSVDSIRTWTRQYTIAGRRVGLVPTMGALHEGHLSLVRQAKQECDVCVATIFVNPTQFAPTEDLSRYPRPLERDLELLRAEGADGVFLPDEAIMYPEGFGTYVMPPPVGLPLEGQSRPEHFRGVTTVVMKLFQIVGPDAVFFGRKDFQQLRVIEDMTCDLNVPVRIVPCDIVRDPDGLAMSSRNRYLSADERQRALSLSRALHLVEELVSGGERSVAILESAMKSELKACDSVDYAVVVDAKTLQPIECVGHAGAKSVALLAARLGNTRLIDNRVL
ncbi:pantothenate synthetase [Neorhodopirellula lusitana]|uniref:Pantothenate synthetase n=1 Tax=Neorhodopirellula lusitana TaxID=445327 RepID=A0ABY1Q1X3_9BACT|nr:pantoate--beta-alanine ligase [Neorhodopirellula lusitana]SMP54005.1 pantothenate synthetase [Neorhodopirellula lusitana]